MSTSWSLVFRPSLLRKQARGVLASVTDPLGNTTNFYREFACRLTNIVYFPGVSAAQSRYFTYDQNARIATMT